MTAAVKTLSSSPMMVKVFGVTPSRASGCMSCMTRCLTRCCMRLLNICLLYHTLHLEERCCVISQGAAGQPLGCPAAPCEIMLHAYAVPAVLVCSRDSAPSASSLAHPRACHLERSDQLRWWRVHLDYFCPQTKYNRAQ